MLILELPANRKYFATKCNNNKFYAGGRKRSCKKNKLSEVYVWIQHIRKVQYLWKNTVTHLIENVVYKCWIQSTEIIDTFLLVASTNLWLFQAVLGYIMYCSSHFYSHNLSNLLTYCHPSIDRTGEWQQWSRWWSKNSCRTFALQVQ